MERKKASDYPQELLDLFHEYQHGDIDRRTFLDRAGKLRKGDVGKSSLTAKAYDTGYHFMLAELGKTAMNFQTVNQDGKVIDSAALPRFSDADKKKMAVTTPTIGPR